jgi:sulfotransferase family protein
MTKRLAHPDWVRRLNLFGDVVGGPERLVALDGDELLALARATTGLGDVGEAEWPGWTETYERMARSLDEESRLHLLGRVTTRGEVLRVLQTWLELQACWQAEPAIARLPVDAPLFVVGPPRTGTTILFELLALDPQLRAPLAWEALHPLREPKQALAFSECEQEFWADIDPEFMTMHELASNLPCECVHFLSYDFAGPYWSMLFDTPSFTGWQLEHLESLERVYRLHRRMLQTFEHRRPGPPGRRWLLKSPGHLSTMPALFAEYPDARVIQSHRDPRKFIASLVSLLSVLRYMRSDHVDVAALGATMEMTYQFFLEQLIAQRADGTIPAGQVADIHFLDLMAAPAATVRRAYDALGLPWPDGHDERIEAYLVAKPKAKHGAHEYTYADVGLDEAHVRASFANYVEYFGITEE